jgi:ATP-dependent helicase HrpA
VARLRWPTPKASRQRTAAAREKRDLMDAVVDGVDELCRLGSGDVLVFLPGEREIRDCAEALRKHHPPHVEILPLFARLSAEEQERVFKVTNARRIVLATNVAETSLTVPGIRYVVDAGLARVKRYSYRNKVEQLQVEPIAQSAANQRAGRCGRVADGVCIRLYEEQDFLQRPKFTEPEILRSSLAAVILRMKSLHLTDVETFPFIEPPQGRAIADGYQLLQELGAVDDANQLTPLGRKLAKLPLDPRVGRMILAALDNVCLTEMLIIASALSVQDPRDRPMEHQQAGRRSAQEVRRREVRIPQLPEDLALVRGRDRAQEDQPPAAGQLPRQLPVATAPARMARRAFAAADHRQGAGLAPERSAGHLRKAAPGAADRPAGQYRLQSRGRAGRRLPRRARHQVPYLAGFLAVEKAGQVDHGGRAGRHHAPVRALRGADPARVAGEGRRPPAEKIVGRAALGKTLGAGDGVRTRDPVRHGGLQPAPHQLRLFNPAEAREIFIRDALVGGDYETRAPFFAHNHKLIKEIENLEHKSRRLDVLVDDQLIAAFYDKLIPKDVVNGAGFEKWYKDATRDKPKLLYLNREELMRHEAAGVTTDLFPKTMNVTGIEMGADLSLRAGQPCATASPGGAAVRAEPDPARARAWLVPGMLKEKVHLLLKSLPQKLRRHCVPLPDYAAKFCERVQEAGTSAAAT